MFQNACGPISMEIKHSSSSMQVIHVCTNVCKYTFFNWEIFLTEKQLVTILKVNLKCKCHVSNIFRKSAYSISVKNLKQTYMYRYVQCNYYNGKTGKTCKICITIIKIIIIFTFTPINSKYILRNVY